MELTWGIFYQAWEGYLRRMSQGTGLLCRPCKHAQYRHSHSVKYRRGWPASNKPRWYIHQRPQPQPDGTSESRGRGTLPQSDNVTTVSAGKGEDLVAYMKNNYGKGNVSEEFVRSSARNLSAFQREFMRMRVEWCNIILTTVMLVTSAPKTRTGTRTKRDIFNGAFNDIWDAIFTFIYKFGCILYFGKKKQRLVDSLDLAMLCYYKAYYFICFTLISLHLREFRIPCNECYQDNNVTKTRFCWIAI